MKNKRGPKGSFLFADILRWNLLHPSNSPIPDETSQAGTEEKQRPSLGGRLIKHALSVGDGGSTEQEEKDSPEGDHRDSFMFCHLIYSPFATDLKSPHDKILDKQKLSNKHAKERPWGKLLRY